MPYISLTTSQQVTPEKAEELKAGFGKLISLIPGKREAALMLRLDGAAAGCAMFFGGQAVPCAYIDVRMFRTAQTADKEALAAEALRFVAQALDIAIENVFLSFGEYQSWGMRGALAQA